MHRLDPRAKLALLVMFSVCLFLVDTWAGMGLCALLFLAMVAVAKLPLGQLAKTLVPLYFILAFTLVFNALTLNPQAVESYGVGGLSGGFFDGSAPVVLWGSLAFVPGGLERGAFYVVRIALLCMAGLVLAYTTESERLTMGLEYLLRPLQKLGLPTQDLSMMLTVALRFIPLSVEELQQIRMAQMARGASFETGGPVQRVKAWGPVMVPLFVNLYRRAETLAFALDARCYGAEPVQTSMRTLHLAAFDWVALVAGSAACVALAVLL